MARDQPLPAPGSQFAPIRESAAEHQTALFYLPRVWEKKSVLQHSFTGPALAKINQCF
jgi:hypothetical protein